MVYSKGGIPNRRSSSGRLALKVELIVAAMANFYSKQNPSSNDGYGGYLIRKR
jgi:hypothetical protein